MNQQAIFFYALLQTIFLTTSLVNACGKYEFYAWADLPEAAQSAAMKLNYDEESWDIVGTNPIDKFSLNQLLSGINEPIEFKVGDEELAALKELDLYDAQSPKPGSCWDFFVNHYMGFSWDELVSTDNPFGNNLAEAASVLGWDKEMWDSTSSESDIPESECKTWWALSPDEQWALQSFGWTGMKWMSYSLDPRCPTPETNPN
jgi:hypothetical protein